MTSTSLIWCVISMCPSGCCYYVCIFRFFFNAWEWDGGGGVHVGEKRWRGREKRRIRLTAHVFAACQPLLREDLVWSVRIQAHNYFAKYWTVRTINPRGLCRSERLWVAPPLRASRWHPLACVNKRRCAPLCLSAPHSVTDEYKMKGVEKVKYLSGEEGGVDGQDSTVCDSIVLLVCSHVCDGTFSVCYDGLCLHACRIGQFVIKTCHDIFQTYLYAAPCSCICILMRKNWIVLTWVCVTATHLLCVVHLDLNIL